MAKAFVRERVSIVSPLRYPGAKRRLGAYIAKVLKLNKIKPKLFAEIFAGGASVALQLLKEGLVESIALGERDPLIASFWKTVFFDADWLIDEIYRTPVTVEQWLYFKNTRFYTRREQAMACFFLNRTSFSGILAPNAGPIGGYEQKSTYKIDCRYNIDALTKRIREANALSENVLFVEQKTWDKTIEKVQEYTFDDGEVFYYLDPPFYEKAMKLYRHYFNEEDHDELHSFLVKLKSPWLLSYDPAKPILDKYSSNGSRPKRIGLLYSTSKNGNLTQADELIITNLTRLPKATRLWRTSNEWKNCLSLVK